MYIKQIIINGFKSYKEHTVIEPLDKRHNVVVGRNGAGKSNFFSAIQFVLSDEYAHLKHEQRQSLLHQSTGPMNIDAFVEIIFDNSDLRIPIEKAEIQLRRIIGLKKDQYYLNGKIIPRSEVLNLLESAGFSSSNSYYIVKQGTINQIATAPDSYRLKVLREVAGTKVFDDRRDEWNATIREMELKLQNFDALLNSLDERLNALEEQKEELKQYQFHDKTRRTLEFVIHENLDMQYKEKLAELEKCRLESYEEQEKTATDKQIAENHIKTLTKKSKETQREMTLLEEEKSLLNVDNQQFMKKKYKLELTIKDLIERKKTKQNKEVELKRLDETIREKKTELETVKPQFEDIKRQEETYANEVALKERRIKELADKQNRCALYTTKAARDAWINNELKSLDQQLKNKKQCYNNLCADSERDQQEIDKLTKKIDAQTKELETYKKNVDECNERIIKLQTSKGRCQTTRNELWLKQDNFQQKFNSLKYDLSKVDSKLLRVVGKRIIDGCENVRKVVDTLASRGGEDAEIANGYYGTVIDSITYVEEVTTAVDVTAGSVLFNHVVKSDVVATRILKEFNEQNLPGELYFMALNRVNSEIQKYPTLQDAAPLISLLKYDKKFDKAMRFIFGKTLLCSNLDVASKVAHDYRLNCVTLEGDKVSTNGAMTGGWYNPAKSILQNYKIRTELNDKVKEHEQKLQSLNADLQRTEKTMIGIDSDLQKMETEKIKLKGIYDRINGELHLARERLASIQRLSEASKQALTLCMTSLEAFRSTKEALKSELKQDALSQLPAADQDELRTLNDEVIRLQREKSEVVNARMRLEDQKVKLENLLTNNLKRQRDSVVNSIEEIALEERKLVQKSAEFKEVKTKIDQTNEKLEEADKKIEEFAKKMAQEQKQLEEWKEKLKILKEKFNENAKLLAKFADQQILLEQKIAKSEFDKNLLGPLPSQDLYKKFMKMSSKSLFKELKNAKDKLNTFNFVNKKALDEYKRKFDEKEKLVKKKESLIRAYDKIIELFSVIEQRKMEVVHFTFKQISMYFTELFKKLVPSGSARLVLITKDAVVTSQESTPSDVSDDNLTGIGIKVAFIQAEVEMKEIQQLSGGQKSLVALALIFAIQKCDPAPFYLFDEIDQALDTSYRRSVSDMIHELSEHAQFITTTFRPELLEHANKFYGVLNRNKVSYIECVNKEVARDFVEDEQVHN